MGEDLREENARLREQLHRIRQVCELHRKMGEDTAFEIREVKRNLELLKDKVEQTLLHFGALSTQIALEGTEGMKMSIELCSATLKGVARMI
jgi:hypothetical protein